MSRTSRWLILRVAASLLFVVAFLNLGQSAGPQGILAPAPGPAAALAASGCSLGNGIQHVIYIQFDNLHLSRDNPNVPSDLEQMPHLLNFIEGNGVMINHEHTPLIAHTANDIITSLTGLYPDEQGLAVANSFRYYNPDGSTRSNSAFVYWTDRLNGTADQSYVLLGHDGKNAPAPWVPYTRAGCNVGAAGMADMELENTGTDITTVFGSGSPEATEAHNNGALAAADFEGLAVHCAQDSTVCSSGNGGVSDVLPDESGGYNGYMALFGNKFVQPQISPGGPVADLFGNVITNAGSGTAGYPGFDPTAAQSLAYVAAMQEHGVPVTYAYIADAHDANPGGGAYGPGEAGYEQQLKSYDDAFGAFFQRLANDGITTNNTLFVVTADENDHFVGGPPSPANCDGVTVPCTYSQIGEIDTNLPGLLSSEQGITTPFTVHEDSAPPVYITGRPAATDPTTRDFERATGQLTATDPYTGQPEQLTDFMADPAELSVLHMVTGDPNRTPSFVLFGNPNNFFCMGESWCSPSSPYTTLDDGAAWNHGDVSPDINTTWLGMAGPGVRRIGLDSSTWASETDTRPTMMALLGLHDDYTHEGRVLLEDLNNGALPSTLSAHRETLLRLAQVYEQINSPVGQLGLATLSASTQGLESNNTDDATYTQTESWLQGIASQRNSLAATIGGMLEDAEFNGQALNEQAAKQAIAQVQALLAQADAGAQ